MLTLTFNRAVAFINTQTIQNIKFIVTQSIDETI